MLCLQRIWPDLVVHDASSVKEGKKVAKIIIAEGKAEKKALDDALKELADLQKLQKAAVKVRAITLPTSPSPDG